MKVNFKFLSILLIILILSTFTGIYFIKNYNLEKGEKIKEINEEISFYYQYDNCHYYSPSEIAELREELKNTQKIKGFTGESVRGILLLIILISFPCFIAIGPMVLKREPKDSSVEWICAFLFVIIPALFF